MHLYPRACAALHDLLQFAFLAAAKQPQHGRQVNLHRPFDCSETLYNKLLACWLHKAASNSLELLSAHFGILFGRALGAPNEPGATSKASWEASTSTQVPCTGVGEAAALERSGAAARSGGQVRDDESGASRAPDRRCTPRE
jgi:hypothetical protein